MRTYDTSIKGISTVMFDVHTDERGTFVEAFSDANPQLNELFPTGVAQVSVASSKMDVVRGLHFQYDSPMAKLMFVIKGMARIVNVDMRPNSPSYLRYVTMDIHESMGLGVYADAWCARGYTALLPNTTILYLHDATFNPTTSITIDPFDYELGIDWGVEHASSVISEKDRRGMSIAQWQRHSAARHPIFEY